MPMEFLSLPGEITMSNGCRGYVLNIANLERSSFVYAFRDWWNEFSGDNLLKLRSCSERVSGKMLPGDRVVYAESHTETEIDHDETE